MVAENGREITVKKTNHNNSIGYKVYNYSLTDIDFFVGVDISSKDIYVIPSVIWSKYKSTMAIGKLDRNGYKNNLELIKNFGVLGGN
jgi:hypothetical protein